MILALAWLLALDLPTLPLPRGAHAVVYVPAQEGTAASLRLTIDAPSPGAPARDHYDAVLRERGWTRCASVPDGWWRYERPQGEVRIPAALARAAWRSPDGAEFATLVIEISGGSTSQRSTLTLLPVADLGGTALEPFLEGCGP